jgi:tetratricopeptide (TPR) repeat protein
VEVKYGKIFKLSEYLTFCAVCQFYLEEYSAAMDSFIEAIELKRAALEQSEEEGEGEGEFEEEEAEKLVFINQMYYNLALCCCLMQDYPNAERYLRKCAISPELHNYDTYLELLDHITGRQPVDQGAQYLDLFSMRNKLSKYLPKVQVPFVFNATDTVSFRTLKLCIPYPKVEPPEIAPPFDLHLI